MPFNHYDAIPFHELRRRLEACAVYDDTPPDIRQSLPGVAIFRRGPVMGLGSAFVPVHHTSDDQLIPGVVVQHVLDTLGVPLTQWMESRLAG